MSVPDPVGRWVPDPLAPSGFRWQRYDEQPPTSMLPTTAAAVPARTVRYGEHEDHVLPVVEQEDLSEYDSDPDLEIVPTEKLGPLDEVLIQPPQDPEWRP